jgi:hypothetical protein
MVDLETGGLVFGLGELALVAVILLSLLCSRLGRSGPWLYASLATGVVAGLIGGVVGLSP